jgi:drug/metabolite transporter (DMT)-like permease
VIKSQAKPGFFNGYHMQPYLNLKECFYFCIMLLVALSWGGHANLMKPAMGLIDNAYLWMVFQNTPIVIILLLYHTLHPIPDLFDRRHIPYAIIVGSLAYGVANPVVALTTHHTSVSYMMLMIGLTSAMTYISALCAGNEIVSIKKIIGVMLAFIAVAYYFYENLAFNSNHSWYLIGLLTPLSFGIQNITIKRWARHQLDIRGLIFYQCLYSLIMLFIWLYYQPPLDALHGLKSFDAFAYFVLLMLGLTHFSGQYFFYYLVARVNSLLYASQASTLAIIFGIVLATIFFGDPITVSLIIATTLILFAIHLCY